MLGKLSDGLLAQASENHRRRRSLSKPSRWKSNVRVQLLLQTLFTDTNQAAHSRALDIIAEFNRFRHHYAARRCYTDDIARSRTHERSYGTLDSMARQMYRST